MNKSSETAPARRDARLSATARRKAIMDAAKALFLSKGYAATTLEEIVTASGGSLATVYQLFGNKQGLWEALVADVSDQVIAPVQAALVHHGEPRAVLKEFARRLDGVERSSEVAGALRLMITEGASSPELARTLFAKGPDASRRIVAAYLDTEVTAGRLVIADTTLATEQFCSLVCADTVLRSACGVLTQASPEDLDRRLDAAVDVFMKTYGRR